MTKRIVRPRLHVLRIMVFSFEAELTTALEAT